MRNNIHPKLFKIIATCSCGNIIEIHSILNKKITVDVCYLCHPFYTGKQRKIIAGGRINLFNKRFSNLIKDKQ